MRRHLALRALFALSISSGFASACLYEIPSVVPLDEAGSDAFIPLPDQTVPRPDGPTPFDAGGDAGCTLRCKTTVVGSASGARINAIAVDRGKSTLYLALDNVIGQTTIGSLELDGKQHPVSTITAAPITGQVAALTAPTPAGELFFVNGGTLRELDIAGGGVGPVGGADAAAIPAQGLAAELDVANQQVFVRQSTPSRITAVSYVDGTATPLATPSSTTNRPLAFSSGGVYWFDGAGTLASLRRVPAVGGTTLQSGSTFLSVFSVVENEAAFATSSQIVALTPGTVTVGSVLVSTTTTAKLLAVPGGGAAQLPAWVENTSSGVVKMLTASATTSSTTVPNPEIGVGALNLSFLFFNGTELYAAGNATTSAYVVHLHD